jgi:hypothetical protein
MTKTEEVEAAIDDFEKRWTALFEELKKETITPNEFDYILEHLRFELIDLVKQVFLHSADNREFSRLGFLLERAENKVASRMSTSRAISVSRWKDKHPGLLTTLSSFFPKKMDINLTKIEK